MNPVICYITARRNSRFDTWFLPALARQLQPGETVLVLGAGGGVGLTAIECAKAIGATVIAAASSPEKLALAAAAVHAELSRPVSREDAGAPLVRYDWGALARALRDGDAEWGQVREQLIRLGSRIAQPEIA